MKLFDYPDRLAGWDEKFNRYAMMKTEYGAEGVADKMAEIEALLQEKLDELAALPDDAALTAAEPDDLDAIKALRPDGARRMWDSLPDNFRSKLEGALVGRCAGCTLGSIVENWDVERMERWAAHLGDAFPLVDYWSQAEQPHNHKYQTSLRQDFTPAYMDGVPTDDDINYTQLGLLVLETYGTDFSVDDMGEAWVRWLPFAFTAEGIALENLRNGVPAMEAGDLDNPCVQYIGADIRSDPWGYAAPGYPELAAEFAWRDAYISHRRNGIYGAMYFSAAIAAAFAVDDTVDALRIGLEEIPADSYFAREMRWALDEADNISGYKDARAAVDARYPGMHRVHAINNAVLTIWGLTVGGDDYTKVIGETVAMGLDNDCTAATAGSIWGAVYGIDAIPERWHKNFNNKVHTYLIGETTFAIDDMLDRYVAQAGKALGG